MSLQLLSIQEYLMDLHEHQHSPTGRKSILLAAQQWNYWYVERWCERETQVLVSMWGNSACYKTFLMETWPEETKKHVTKERLDSVLDFSSIARVLPVLGKWPSPIKHLFASYSTIASFIMNHHSLVSPLSWSSACRKKGMCFPMIGWNKRTDSHLLPRTRVLHHEAAFYSTVLE